MRAPAFWWRPPGLEAALLQPFAALYGAIAAARLKRSGVRAPVPVICVGNFVAGKIGEATGGESGDMTKEATLAIYQEIGLITIGVSVVVLALSPIVKKWMHLDTLRDRDDSVAGAGELAEPQAAGTHPEPKGA